MTTAQMLNHERTLLAAILVAPPHEQGQLIEALTPDTLHLDSKILHKIIRNLHRAHIPVNWNSVVLAAPETLVRNLISICESVSLDAQNWDQAWNRSILELRKLRFPKFP